MTATSSPSTLTVPEMTHEAASHGILIYIRGLNPYGRNPGKKDLHLKNQPITLPTNNSKSITRSIRDLCRLTTGWAQFKIPFVSRDSSHDKND